MMMSVKFVVTSTCILFSNGFKLSSYHHTSSGTKLSMSSDSIPVMVNGMPGLMALETAMSCIDNGLKLVPYGFTGSDITVLSADSADCSVWIDSITKKFFNISHQSGQSGDFYTKCFT